VSRREENSGRSGGNEAARIPVLSSTLFQMLKEKLKNESVFSKKLESRYSLIIDAAQALDTISVACEYVTYRLTSTRGQECRLAKSLFSY
jgi:hypothetical protein